MAVPAAGQCPICAATAAPLFPAVNGYAIDRCSACGHAFCRDHFGLSHTTEAYDDDYFNGGGLGYPDYLAEADVRRRFANWYARRLNELNTVAELTVPGQALDIGCAAGFLMQGLADHGWRVSGIDPNCSMVGHARSQLGLDAHVGQTETLSRTNGLTVPVRGYDLVMMVQVIAHLIDPRVAIAEVARVLAPGGVLLVETWDSASFVARTLGARWHEYSPPSALHYFTHASLDRLMATQSLTRIDRGRAPKRLQIAHLRSFARHRYGMLGRMLAALLQPLPGQWGVPYPGDDLFFAIYRKP
ncbi:MAG: class I SAM-dependent methyltransferase [Burkholderiaceae bacterium]